MKCRDNQLRIKFAPQMMLFSCKFVSKLQMHEKVLNDIVFIPFLDVANQRKVEITYNLSLAQLYYSGNVSYLAHSCKY